MSTRLLYSLTDDKPGMQKQIGCMNGIFQLFDRQSFLPGRRLNGHNHKRLLAGQNASVDAEQDGVSQKSVVKNSKATKFERHRLSSDSSRSSVSSSCNSSSFSSLEENRPTKLEPSLFRLTTTQNNQPHDSPLYHLNATEHLSGQSPDLSDIAKSSNFRESHGVSLRPPTKDKAAVLTYTDSPRPLNPSKSVKPKTSHVSKSFGVLPNLHRPQISAEQMEIDSFCSLSKKDAPRFSYDGRESRDALKSNFKLKELPRHSLDSKRGSMSLSSQSQSRCLQGNHQRVNHSIGQTVNSPRPQGSHARQSSVVAKLMGLEALPDSMSNSKLQVGHSRTNSIEAFDPFSISSRTFDRNKPALLSGSPRKSQRSAISQQEATADSVMQFNPSSEFPIQATTWKRPEGSQSPAVPVPESTASHSKASNATLSVYGEIEKRLAQLEFLKSGKDLRALKQILEAIQKSKETLENKKDVQASEFMLQTSSCSSGSRLRGAPCGNIKSEAPDSPKIKKISSPKNLQSPIVEKLKVPGSPVNSTSGLANLWNSPSSRRKSVEQQQNEDLTPRKVSSRQPHFLDRRIGSRNTLMRVDGDHQHVSEKNSSCGNSGTSSPRLTLKESRATDAQRKSNPGKQTKEPRSPGRTPKSKTNHVPLSSDRVKENSSHTIDLSDENNTISLQSAASMDSQDDTEVSSVYSFAEIRGTFPPDDQTRKKTVPSREQELSRKPGIPTTEQPSPVSVLDASYFEDETPSPVKMTSGAFKDDDVSGELKWSFQELNNFSDSKRSDFGSAINQNSLVNLPLVQNEVQVISTNQGSGTAFPSESTSSDHAYISEILSASGLLSDLDSGLMTIRHYSSGHLISGNLFHTLEQTKASNDISSGDQARERTVQSKRGEKMRRKLIFDVVSEILVHRVASDHSRNWFSSDKLAGRKAAQQRLLKGLCSEIDQLQTDRPHCRFDDEDDDTRTILSKDLTHQGLNWTGSNDISGLVLDIERLIFKDLISEVVSNLAAGPQAQPTGRHRRQLIFK
ncbi:protein LONGIFOLIA 1 [Rhodamnia argentea]|uniref:Protein LONGIFOLIA 1 n=1 Tax=Rhodamnia argentea TaxID=178133 RepID=A0A8B8QLB3_9MYRT|nr:protein LONGIFOLIA 1 [Rhodamnia argentea]